MKLQGLEINTSLKSYLIISVISCVFLSCGLSDDTETEVQIPVDITVLGRDINSLFQANIDEGIHATNYNLTETLGVFPNSILMDFHNYENTFGFYFPPPSIADYTVWEKNVNTNEGIVYNNFCPVSTIETSYFPQVSDKYITLFTAELISTGNRVLNFRIYNKTSDTCTKIALGISSEFQFLTRLIVDDTILTYHINNQNQTVISKISLLTGALDGQLTFDTEGAATVKDNILFFYPNTGGIHQLSYHLSTLQFINSSSFEANPLLGTGMFKTQSLNNSILIEGNYIQPFEFAKFPALLNQESGEIAQVVDLAIINTQLISFLNSDLSMDISQNYAVDFNHNILVGSYILFNSTTTIVEYGVYYADFSGKILGTVPIDFEVSKIVIR